MSPIIFGDNFLTARLKHFKFWTSMLLLIDLARLFFVSFSDGDIPSRLLVPDSASFLRLSPGRLILFLFATNLEHRGLPSLLEVSQGFCFRVTNRNRSSSSASADWFFTSSLLLEESWFCPCPVFDGNRNVPLFLFAGFQTSPFCFVLCFSFHVLLPSHSWKPKSSLHIWRISCSTPVEGEALYCGRSPFGSFDLVFWTRPIWWGRVRGSIVVAGNVLLAVDGGPERVVYLLPPLFAFSLTPDEGIGSWLDGRFQL